jgi:lysophospholipase L1-like esterase
MSARLLMPIALMQGFWLLRCTPRLPTPADRCGRVGIGRGSPLRVVGVGDSVMAGSGVRDQRHSLTGSYARLLQERLDRDVEWRVHGSIGATSAAVLERVAPAAPAAHVYLLSMGVNDVAHRVEATTFAENLAAVMRLLRRKSPTAAILFGGLPPLDCFPSLPWPLRSVMAERARELQEAAVRVTACDERARCHSFPPAMAREYFAEDGFHPAEDACQTWASRLLELWSPSLAVTR